MSEQKKNRITLKDIANVAGISVNSVSRALKGSKNISQQTIENVNRIANEMGYVPDVHAQSLRNGSFKVIAVVYDNLTNPYYSIMMDLLNSELEKKEYESMIFVDHHNNGYLSDILAKRILSYRVSGIITFIAPTNEAAKILKNNRIPLVLIGRKCQKINSVFSNDYKGGVLAAEKLLEYGGKNFCYITEHGELDINTLRYNGFSDTLNKNNISRESQNVIIGSYETNIKDEIIKLTSSKKIDSIFCFSDLIAFKVISILFDLKITVPKDINVIGYDNLQEQLPYPMRLSSIDGGKHSSIDKTLQLLFSQIDNEYKERASYIEVDVYFEQGTTTIKKD